jgi:hydroxylamine reductase
LAYATNPGILISGHDLRDMEDLLKQTEGTGVDVYTHSEMLPANYYPAFKKYKHFIGNYGSSWWKQKEDFETFNGPILFTTNCIVPPSRKMQPIPIGFTQPDQQDFRDQFILPTGTMAA